MAIKKFLATVLKKGFLPAKKMFSEDGRKINLIKSLKLEEDLYLIDLDADFRIRAEERLKNEKGDYLVRLLFPVLKDFSQPKLLTISEAVKNNDFLYLLQSLIKWEREIRLKPYFNFWKLTDCQQKELLTGLEASGEVKFFGVEDFYAVNTTFLNMQFEKLKKLITEEKTKKSELIVLDKLARRLDFKLSNLPVLYLLKKLVEQEDINLIEGKIFFGQKNFSHKQEAILKSIAAFLKKEKLVVFSIDQLINSAICPESELLAVIFSLWNDKQLFQISSQFFIFNTDLDKFINRLKKHKRNNSDLISIQELKDLTGLSRKYLIPLLEYFDQQKITARLKDKRKIILAV